MKGYLIALRNVFKLLLFHDCCWQAVACSTSAADTFSLPLLMTSFMRPTSHSCPSASSRPLSPVLSHPPVRALLLTVALEHNFFMIGKKGGGKMRRCQWPFNSVLISSALLVKGKAAILMEHVTWFVITCLVSYVLPSYARSKPKLD